jgi:hypothetical protein
MLHGNTADGFRAAMGDPLNEGCTQMLAVRALLAANVPPPDSIPYEDEMRVADTLAELVGIATGEAAYFSGGASIAALVAAVDGAHGAGTLANVKAACDGRNFPQAVNLLSGAKGDFEPPPQDGTATA